MNESAHIWNTYIPNKPKDLFHCWQNVSNSTLYPDVLKIKTNCCETKFYKNAICLLFTNFQIHHLATLLPGRPSNRVARYGFVNKKMAFLKNFVWQQSLFCFQNIWIQCQIRHILSTLKQILGFKGNLEVGTAKFWKICKKIAKMN